VSPPDEGDGAFACPLPLDRYSQVLLAHGGGGTLSHRLTEELFRPAFGSQDVGAHHDGAVFESHGGRLAFTTDSYVVQPLFFPGGDIGTLAVNGTVNDLAMCGARPLYLSAGFILEEGLPIETLWRVACSMGAAAERAGVRIVTGDTKVVDRGKGDGVFINTAGVGVVEHDVQVAPASVRPGDVLLLSGDIGRHGIAIMAEREGLAFESTIRSDCAPLADLVQTLLAADVAVHCLRDLTRGGLASALVEIAEAAGLHLTIDEDAVAVQDAVRGACELLGFDPLYVANEGRLIAFVAPEDAERALSLVRAHPLGEGAALVGTVADGAEGRVSLRTRIGATRPVHMLSGEQLPRIC